MKRWTFALLAPLALVACGGSADGPSQDADNDTRGDAPSRVTSASATTPAPATPAPSRDESPAPNTSATAVAPRPEPAGPPPFSIPAPPTSTPAPAPSPAPSSEPPRPDVPAPAFVQPVPGSCPFYYLGDWIRCENAGWPNVVRLESATNMEDCMAACLEREDCTAVTDYFWLGRPDLGCWLYTSTCYAPSGGPWQEEDGGREYIKQCGIR